MGCLTVADAADLAGAHYFAVAIISCTCAESDRLAADVADVLWCNVGVVLAAAM